MDLVLSNAEAIRNLKKDFTVSMSKCIEESITKLMLNVKQSKTKNVGWIGDLNKDAEDDELVEVGDVLFSED
jgi:hypothetical protein